MIKKCGILFLTILLIMNLAGCSVRFNTSSAEVDTEQEVFSTEVENVHYYFRNTKLLKEHFDKHGKEMGFDTPESYEKAASNVINNPDALSKTEKEDGDYVYYIEDTNELVILSVDGYIRTYFKPDSGKRYYDKQ